MHHEEQLKDYDSEKISKRKEEDEDDERDKDLQ